MRSCTGPQGLTDLHSSIPGLTGLRRRVAVATGASSCRPSGPMRSATAILVQPNSARRCDGEQQHLNAQNLHPALVQ